MKGYYTTSSGERLEFNAYQTEPGTVIIVLEGQSGEIARLFPTGKGSFFHVTKDVFDQFMSHVINMNVSWTIPNPIIIPGTWTTPTNGGRGHKKRSGHKKRNTRRCHH